MKKVTEAQLKGKKVILRVDFNVPLNSAGKITDDARIKAALRTIKYILNSGAQKLFILSHLGQPVVRPREKIDNIISGNKNLSLKPVAEILSADLGLPNRKISLSDIEDSVLPGYELSDKLALLENVRFLQGEKKNSRQTARKLALLGDIYVNDAFGVLHRKQASVCAITEFLPAYYGYLIDKELKTLDKLAKNPDRPFVMIMGGAKIVDKMKIIEKMVNKVDYFLLGGVMANTFLSTRNIDVKRSIIEPKSLPLAKKLMDKAASKIILPADLVWNMERIVDIKSGTISQYQKYIAKAKTIFFNGTLGLTSQERFSKGTDEVLRLIAANKQANTVICGGDTIAEVNKHNMADQFTYVSTGGGATLNYLAGEKLPGLEALNSSVEE